MDEYIWLDKFAQIKNECMLMGYQFKQNQLLIDFSVKGKIIMDKDQEISVKKAKKVKQMFNQN